MSRPRVDYGAAVKPIRMRPPTPPDPAIPQPFPTIAELGIRYLCPQNHNPFSICMYWTGAGVRMTQTTQVSKLLEMDIVNEDPERALAIF